MTLFEICKQELEIMRQNKATTNQLAGQCGTWIAEIVRGQLSDSLGEYLRDLIEKENP
jgi:hypothetical protein